MGEVDHAFGALNTLLLAMLLGFCIFAAYMIKRYSFYYLPESAAAIIIGCVVGAVISFLSTREEINFLTFDPEIFFFVFLPPIIFEAGYSLRYFLFETSMTFLTILIFNTSSFVDSCKGKKSFSRTFGPYHSLLFSERSFQLSALGTVCTEQGCWDL